MSEQEQDAIVGRLMRERKNAKRQLAIMSAEIATIASSLRDVADALRDIAADANLSVAIRALQAGPLAKCDNAKLLAFLVEYTVARSAVSRMEQQLHELDVE
jgi:hypothetical protein